MTDLTDLIFESEWRHHLRHDQDPSDHDGDEEADVD